MSTAWGDAGADLRRERVVLRVGVPDERPRTGGGRVPWRGREREQLGVRPEPEPVAEPEPAPVIPAGAPVDEYDVLEAEEVISLLGSLDGEDLIALREYEASSQKRDAVLRAIDGVLARREPAGTR